MKQLIKEYCKLLDLEYSKTPKNAGKLLKATIRKTDNKILSISKNGILISAVTLIKLPYNIFIIHELITKEEYRNKGIGIKLMKRVHCKYKGIFIVKTTNAKRFYEKIGYKYISNNILIYINDKNLLGRRY